MEFTHEAVTAGYVRMKTPRDQIKYETQGAGAIRRSRTGSMEFSGNQGGMRCTNHRVLAEGQGFASCASRFLTSAVASRLIISLLSSVIGKTTLNGLSPSFLTGPGGKACTISTDLVFLFFCFWFFFVFSPTNETNLIAHK